MASAASHHDRRSCRFAPPSVRAEVAITIRFDTSPLSSASDRSISASLSSASPLALGQRHREVAGVMRDAGFLVPARHGGRAGVCCLKRRQRWRVASRVELEERAPHHDPSNRGRLAVRPSARSALPRRMDASIDSPAAAMSAGRVPPRGARARGVKPLAGRGRGPSAGATRRRARSGAAARASTRQRSPVPAGFRLATGRGAADERSCLAQAVANDHSSDVGERVITTRDRGQRPR
jgi:hypothetical protein